MGRKKKRPSLNVDIEEVMSAVLKRLKENFQEYGARILFTLELNKLEGRFQQNDQPRIYRRVSDELGIVETYEIHPNFVGVVPEPKTEFFPVEYEWLANQLVEPADYNTVKKWAFTFICLQTQRIFEDSPIDTKPFFVNKIDENGLIVASKLNFKPIPVTEEEFNAVVRKVFEQPSET